MAEAPRDTRPLHAEATCEAVPRWLCLWLPVGYLAAETAFWAIDREDAFYSRIFQEETGFVEVATAVVLVPAVILAIRGALRAWRGRERAASALYWVLALGCLFLLGEEISYGQHFFGWGTPELLAEHNVQGETNLHNLEGFNKNLLKWLTLLGMLVTGIVLPLALRRRAAPGWLARSSLGRVLVGSTVCLPTAVIAIGMHLLVKTLWWSYGFEFHEHGYPKLRETTELYIAFFLFLYALALWRGDSLSARARGAPARP